MRKTLIGLLAVVALIAAACGGASLEGEEVLIFGAPATDGPDGKAIQAAMDEFSEDTGIIVTYVGSENLSKKSKFKWNQETLLTLLFGHNQVPL